MASDVKQKSTIIILESMRVCFTRSAVPLSVLHVFLFDLNGFDSIFLHFGNDKESGYCMTYTEEEEEEERSNNEESLRSV